jgi:Protein involved in formate dehydrogenase formation
MNSGKWDRRIHRATELTSVYPFAAEGLGFYTHVAKFQRSLYADFRQSVGESLKVSSPGRLPDEWNLPELLPKFPELLALIERIAPPPLAQAAASLMQRSPGEWQQVMEDFCRYELAIPEGSEAVTERGDDGAEVRPAERLLAWIFLQPYAEYLADRRAPRNVAGTPSTCPLCGGKPIVGVLRAEGDGAKKSLICMLCGHEWTFRRIYCPACGEEREPQIAFYSAPEIAHVRVDVCDTCHTYLKSVDLTKMGLAVPVVDELATIPLDIWARAHGYEKLQINLLGA